MSTVTHRLGGGATETVVKDDNGRVLAVVTRPCAGAKFFLHRYGKMCPQGERFPSLKAAIAAVS